MNLKKELLQKSFVRKNFDCGVDVLNNYLKFQASQDVKKKLSVCFAFVEAKVVKGYYTLSSSSIPFKDVPPKFSKKFPLSYTHIPVILLGRLAVDKTCKGKGYGEYLLIDALKESYQVSKEKIGAVAVIVEPVNNDAKMFYNKYGFIELSVSKKMFLPMNTLNNLFEIKNKHT